MKRVINPNRGGGVSRCLRTTYFKVSLANYLHDDGRAASALIEIENLNEDDNQQCAGRCSANDTRHLLQNKPCQHDNSSGGGQRAQ